MAKALTDLAAAGVAVWLDDLSRTRIHSGSLARSVEAGEIVGITTNPTIFAKAIGTGSGYEDQLRDLALRGTAIGETLRLLTAWDVRAACDILRPVFDRTEGRDGRVSIEVDPRIAQDGDLYGSRSAWSMVAGRSAKSVYQNSGDTCWLAGNHRVDCGWNQYQRYTDFLGGAL